MRAILPINVHSVEIKRLNALVLVNTLEQLCGGGRRGHIEFGLQGFHAGLVLAQGEVILALSAVTPHQAAVGVLTATVTG